jgi:hypothetical protein
VEQRREMGDNVFAFHEAFQLMAAAIMASATVTMREIVRVEILNSGA